MSRAVVIINGNADRERAAQWAKSAAPGIIIEFKQSKRTLDQNARLWACLTEIARKVEWHGMKLPADDWKDIFTAALRKHRFVPGLEENTVVPLGMRTSDMTKQEFSDLLELINAFAAERGIEFKEPSDQAPAQPTDVGDDTVDQTDGVVADLSPDEGEHEDGAGEASPPAADPAPSSVDNRITNLMRECLDKFLQVATADLPVQDRRKNIEFCRNPWKEALPERLEFVRACMQTADQVAKGEMPAADARSYLEGLIR